MKKLWKVTANCWGWIAPRTYYTESREEALKIYKSFPAADPVRYAGIFKEEKAAELIKLTAEDINAFYALNGKEDSK